MLHERDAVDLDVVDFGTELHALVFLAPDNGADIGAIDTDYAVFHLLFLRQRFLLTVYFLKRTEPLALLG